MGIEDIRETVKMCRFCFMCRHACPTFLATKLDSHTPRGYALMLSAIAEGIRNWDEDCIARFYQCSQCGLCKEDCEYHWPEDELVRNAREEIVALKKEPQIVAHIASSIINKGTPYEEEKKWNFPSQHIGKKNPEVLYFAGCSTRQSHPEIIEATSNILNSIGVNWSVLENERCCGMTLLDLGYTEEAKKVAAKLADKISQLEPKILLTGCAHCYRTFREKFSEWKIQLPSNIKVVHTTEYLWENTLNGKLQFTADTPIESVSYHDPCQLGRKLGVYEPPRRLIEKLTGSSPIELFHSREKAECCGAGTTMFLTDPEISEKVARRRIIAAREEKAKVIVTACQNCKTVFTKVHQNDIKILDVTELVSLRL
jgi:Fe-S oxidoreductase